LSESVLTPRETQDRLFVKIALKSRQNDIISGVQRHLVFASFCELFIELITFVKGHEQALTSVVISLKSNSPENQLLARLSQTQYGELLSRLRPIHLKSGQVVHEPRAPVEYAYFPVSGVLSAVVVLSTGNMIEVATVGREGATGLPAFVDLQESPHRVFCQIPGEALRIEVNQLQKASLAEGPFRKMLFSYQAAFFYQVSQSVACNGTHHLEERCCRWLLMTHDRVDADEIELTHEFLAAMLGVRGSSVNEARQVRRRKGLIDYERGKIVVRDRQGMEEASCECYQAVINEYDRLLK